MLLGVTGSAFAQEGGDVAPAPEGGDTSAAPAPAEAAATTDSSAGSSEKKISAALLLGYGVNLSSGGNIFGLGFGVRGGYMITDKIYLGAKFQYDLGASHVKSWLLGIQGGYQLGLADKLALRPELSLGLANTSVSVSTPFGSVSGSSTDLFIEPGATLMYDVTPDIYVGLNVAIPIILAGSTYSGLLFLATAGMRF
ncbi:MAG TPA: outer membrane beta-barrel protein [Polyangiales bacterium]|jgi:outer membrane protein X|nr:outer membrane beta-barrel protein [Polyangiales bacterium]